MIDEEFEDLLPEGPLSERTAALMATVEALEGEPCRACGQRLCGHEAVLAVLLGSRGAPRCLACAASEQGELPAAVGERALQWVRRTDCYLEAWLRAGEREGLGRVLRPAHLFGDAAATATALDASAAPAPPPAAAAFDAGDLGCGELVLQLKFRLADLAPGDVVHVTARDPAAPIDLPAWCGLTGNPLLHTSHPSYWIQRKPTP